MIRRFLGILVDHKLSLHASTWRIPGLSRFPSLRPWRFAPAPSPFIVHLSCFTPLKQQSPVDCGPTWRSCLTAAFSYLGPRLVVKIADLFIYLPRRQQRGYGQGTPESHHSSIQTTVFTLRCENGRGSLLSREDSSRDRPAK